jgi:hypothetical protein
MSLTLNKPKLDNLAGDIWKSAERLRGKFKAYEYQGVILPIIVIRRLECVLLKWREDRKAEIRARQPKTADKELDALVKKLEQNPMQSPFSNKTKWTLRKVYEEDHTLLEENFRAYINGFSKNVDRYLKVSEGTLKDWAILSLKECRMFLESVLLKEEGGFISTGLGGRDSKLRYYVIVSTREGRTLTRSERETLEGGFKGSSDEYETEIEEINFGTNYAMMGILVPMHVAVGELIEEGIRRCNRKGAILFVDYYVTNVKKPTKGEISRYLRDIKREGK